MKSIYTLFTCLLALMSKGQTIQNLEVVPNPASTTDIIEVVAETVHPYSDCPLVSVSFDFENDTLLLETFHELGFLTAICNSTDTIEIGSFPVGVYTLIYESSSGGPSIFGTDRDTVTFVVENTLSLEEDNEENRLTLFPNPASGVCKLHLPSHRINSIRIYDISGREMTNYNYDSSKMELDVSPLPGGIYFVQVDEKYVAKLLVN